MYHDEPDDQNKFGNIYDLLNSGGCSSDIKAPFPYDSPVLKVPGRETAAGRALFALFRGYDVARKRGNQYSQHNLTRIRRQVSQRPPDWCPPKVEAPKKHCPQKQHVKVPHFRSPPTNKCDESKTLPPIGRRKASEIFEQLKLDKENTKLPPHPTKPLLDEKEKARLAFVFEWKGRLDEDDDLLLQVPDPTKLKSPKVQQKKKGSVEEMEEMMDKIQKEIEEREQFMREMESLGQAEKYRSQVRSEIYERIKELKKLDQLIRAHEN